MKIRFPLYVLVFILCMTMLTGCLRDTPPATEQATAPQETQLPETLPENMTDEERLRYAVKWFDKNFSFTMEYLFENAPINGVRQRTEQVFGNDGSWSMVTTQEIWNDINGQRQETTDYHYYRYEDSQLICYSKLAGESQVRIEITEKQLAEIQESKGYLVGAPTFMPDYLEGLYVIQPSGNDAVTVFGYWLPVDKVIEDRTVLSTYMQNVLNLSGKSYPSDASAGILVIFEVDAQTLRPISLTCLFQELKPYILSSNALIADGASDKDPMIVTYVFDFDLPDTAAIPEAISK